jgi:hypothetical protein
LLACLVFVPRHCCVLLLLQKLPNVTIQSLLRPMRAITLPLAGCASLLLCVLCRITTMLLLPYLPVSMTTATIKARCSLLAVPQRCRVCSAAQLVNAPSAQLAQSPHLQNQPMRASMLSLAGKFSASPLRCVFCCAG